VQAVLLSRLDYKVIWMEKFLSVFLVNFAAGVHLIFIQQVILLLVVTIGTMGAAGIAGSGPVVLLAVMSMVGLNVESGSIVATVFGLVFGIDVILDMGQNDHKCLR